MEVDYTKPYAVTFKNDYGLQTYIIGAYSKEDSLRRAIEQNICETFSRVTCSPIFNEWDVVEGNEIKLKVR